MSCPAWVASPPGHRRSLRSPRPSRQPPGRPPLRLRARGLEPCVVLADGWPLGVSRGGTKSPAAIRLCGCPLGPPSSLSVRSCGGRTSFAHTWHASSNGMGTLRRRLLSSPSDPGGEDAVQRRRSVRFLAAILSQYGVCPGLRVGAGRVLSAWALQHPDLRAPHSAISLSELPAHHVLADLRCDVPASDAGARDGHPAGDRAGVVAAEGGSGALHQPQDGVSPAQARFDAGPVGSGACGRRAAELNDAAEAAISQECSLRIPAGGSDRAARRGSPACAPAVGRSAG